MASEDKGSENVTVRGLARKVVRAKRVGDEIILIKKTGQEAVVNPDKRFTFTGMYMSLERLNEKFTTRWEEVLDYCYDNDLTPDKEQVTYSTKVKNAFYEAQSINLQLQAPQASTSSSSHLSTPVDPSKRESSTGLASTLALRSLFPNAIVQPFDGTPTDWLSFKTTFTSLVGRDDNLSDCEKLHFLKHLLKGPALEVIQNIAVTDETYPQAWEALTRTYDNPRRLASHHLEKVLSYKPLVGKPTYLTLKHYMSNVTEVIKSLKKIKFPQSTNLLDYICCELALRCMDDDTREAFELEQAQDTFPTFDAIKDFVERRANSYHALHDSKKTKRETTSESTKAGRQANFKPNSFQPKQSNSFFANTTEAAPRKCGVCSGAHTLMQCDRFRAANPTQRQGLLRNWRGCRNCLCPLHKTPDCKSTYSCKYCKQNHHSLLHVFKPITSSSSPAPTSSNKSPPPSSSTPSSSSQGTDSPSGVCGLANTPPNEGPSLVLLGTAVAKVQNSVGDLVPMRILVDSGSQESFITHESAQALGLTLYPTTKRMAGINNSGIRTILGRVQIKIYGTLHPVELQTTALVVPTITVNLPHTPLPYHIRQQFAKFRLADENYWSPSPISLLIGADLYMDIITGSPITLHPKSPKMVESIFGNLIMGRCPTNTEETTEPEGHCFFQAALSSIMERFWKTEEVAPRVTTSPDDEQCEKHFMKTHRRTTEGRYMASLPFKVDPPPLGPSRPRALTRFYNLERQLAKKPQVRLEYNKFMAEYLSLGHMTLATGPGRYYIPHHGVVKTVDDKLKIRVVFDGSSKTSTGSLNDYLLTGPNLLNDISDIITNFRTHRFALCTDIVKMYRQFLINPDDQPYQTILWRQDPSEPIKEYFLTTVTYGLSASPYLALRSIAQLVKDEGAAYPLAAQALTQDIYVDDVVSGADTIEEVKTLKNQLISLTAKGALELSKWSTNAEGVLDDLSSVDQTPVSLSDDQDGTIKLLGLQWDPSTDQFRYNVREIPNGTTKRVLLSTIGRLFDPLGYVTPVTFQAKCLMQRTWQLNLHWDDQLPPILQEQWSSFVQNLPSLNSIRIPRFVPTKNADSLMVIGFCDSSQLGYCASIYLRIQHGNAVTIQLIKAKSKLAPLKPVLTIPRLELCAALLLTRLHQSLSTCFNQLKITRTYFFTDSSVVLGWLQSPPHLLKTFVAHRVSEILESTTSSWWHHVRSEENSADCGSRGLSPETIENHHLWWSGPAFLMQPTISWPLNNLKPVSTSDLPETKLTSVALLAAGDCSDFVQWTERFSEFPRLIRSLAYVSRFLSHTRKPSTQRRSSIIIDTSEFRQAKWLCIKLVQQHHFPSLRSNDCSEPSLAHLKAFIDSNGVARVGGRLRHANLTYNQRHPVIIPRKSHLAVIIVDFFHRTYLHAGPTTLQAILAQQFWIPAARSLIRLRKFKCLRCYRLSKQPIPPIMADLPADRVQPSYPFNCTGIDFAGPFYCRESLRRKAPISKAYFAIFTCLATRATHLELVPSLTTEHFLDALDRFCARRGTPAMIRSDCGTNFVGASHYLKEVSQLANSRDFQNNVLQHSSPKGITWRFNPPGSPHFGGIWESGVKTAKMLCLKTLGTHPFTRDELMTVLCKVEAVMNSRPLTPMSSDLDDTTALTPSHFLIGRPLVSPPEPDVTNLSMNRLTRWQHIRRCTQDFWNRWRLEYLNTLQQRQKWTKERPNVQAGELVLLKTEHTPPLQWPLARVLHTHPGDDGIVRVVTIRTATGEYKRPVVQLVPLTTCESPTSSANPAKSGGAVCSGHPL